MQNQIPNSLRCILSKDGRSCQHVAKAQPSHDSQLFLGGRGARPGAASVSSRGRGRGRPGGATPATSHRSPQALSQPMALPFPVFDHPVAIRTEVLCVRRLGREA